jgi:hypothetical protein
MFPFGHTFGAGPNPSVPRKIANPIKKPVSAGTRESIRDLIKSSEPRKFADPKRKPISNERRAVIEEEEKEVAAVQEVEMAWAGFDSIQAPLTLEAQARHRRERHGKELLALLSTACRSLSQSSGADPLKHVDPVKLAQAWENKVWATKYEVTFELDKYVDAIEQEIADLDIWVQHWDSELGGEDMFRAHIAQHFQEELKTGELATEGNELGMATNNAMADEISVVEPMASMSPFFSGAAVDFNFGEGPVAFGYCQR